MLRWGPMSSQAPGAGPAVRPVHYEVLPNGLTLLLYEAHLAPVANLQIWAKVGAADERPGEEGLAHFHEQRASIKPSRSSRWRTG